MDQKKVAITTKRMMDARAVLVRDNPFFGRLALGLQLACASCGTACTDGERLIFDPEFAERLKTEQEMQFVILHEVLHCVLEHCTRVGTRDSEQYNIACDIVVNSTILGMWGMDSFQVADFQVMHLAPDGNEGCEYHAEEIYQMLLASRKDDPDQDKHTDTDKSLDRHDVWKAISDSSVIRDIWNGRIRNAAAACKGAEKLPPQIRKIVKDLSRRSNVYWKQLLHDFLQPDEYDYSFLPPDRRFSDGEYYLPAYNLDEEHGSAQDIWVCMDTSASISEQELKEAMLEVQDAMRQAGLKGAVSFFDGDITDPIPFTTEEEFRTITPKGGGGTSYHPIFRLLREQLYPELPKAVLIFTDGYVCSWPKEEAAMEVPVLWLIRKGGNTNVPWGRVVELD
ncbi:MAG: VWA-like domain-containing protein [Eubacteriales bacterium]|nr:VWA-like domain-containing protein [Eubacteriales bacterium]